MEIRTSLPKMPNEKKENNKRRLPDVEGVISEWFSQEHPDWPKHECWWRDHSQYREYHKTL